MSLYRKYKDLSVKELNNCFIKGCEDGCLNEVDFLLTTEKFKTCIDIYADNSRAFRLACLYGHLDVVKYLLNSPELKEHADIHVLNDDGFKYSCDYKYFDAV